MMRTGFTGKPSAAASLTMSARPATATAHANRRAADRLFACAVAVAGLALIVKDAAADGFPVKPVRIIVPYTAGSPNDVMARLLAQHLQGQLGQPVVIDNKSGGGTTIGSKAAASAPAD